MEEATASALHAAEGIGKNGLKDAAESCLAGGLSFTPGTKVLLVSGKAVSISQLKPGEKVLATSTKTGKTWAETIGAVWVWSGSTTTPTCTT